MRFRCYHPNSYLAPSIYRNGVELRTDGKAFYDDGNKKDSGNAIIIRGLTRDDRGEFSLMIRETAVPRDVAGKYQCTFHHHLGLSVNSTDQVSDNAGKLHHRSRGQYSESDDETDMTKRNS